MVVALDDDTIERWRRFARTNGVTISSLIEALGRQIDDDDPSDLLRHAVVDAREIMAERNDRRIP